MERSDARIVLAHYARRYLERVGKMPRKRDLDPALARSLVRMFGGVEQAIHVLDLWFDSPDPWYANEGFSLEKYYTATNRLLATGHIKPEGTPHEQELVRKLAAFMFLRPNLRLVRPERDESVDPDPDPSKGGRVQTRHLRPRR